MQAPSAFLHMPTVSFPLLSHRPSFPLLQPPTALPLASQFLPTLASNFHSRLLYTDKLFPPKRTHYLQGRKQGMISLWRKSLPRTEDPRWKEWEHMLLLPPFVPGDLMLPKTSQEIKTSLPWTSSQPTSPSPILPYYFLNPCCSLQLNTSSQFYSVTQSKRIAFEVNHTFGFRTSNKTFNSVFKDCLFQLLFNLWLLPLWHGH